MQAHRCPICHKPRKPANDNAFFPFCSERCKRVDLGNWLDGRYLVASPAPFDEQGDDLPWHPSSTDGGKPPS